MNQNNRRSGIGALFSRRRRTWTIGVLIVLGAIAFWAVSTATKRESVTIAQVTRGPAIEAVYATGVVEPVHWAKVAPTIVGRITEIAARDGTKVKRGQVLLKLDDTEARAELARREARLRFTKEEVDRYAELAKRSIASQQAYERARSEQLQAIAAVAAARQRLRDYTLYSPLDGVVLRQDGEVGETIKAGDIVAWVGKPTPLRIIAEVDEEDIPLVRVAQSAILTADAFGKRIFKAKVIEITPKGDPISKNYRVRLSLPERTPLHIGMTTEVNIIVRKAEQALIIPFTALRGGSVFVVEQGRARQRAVKTGIVGQTHVQVTGGLKLGERVVADPPKTLKDGARIKTAGKANGKTE